MATTTNTPISICPATHADIPAVISLQFESYATVMVEKIGNPDTPSNRSTMQTKHEEHLRNDPGLRLVKAVASTNNNSSDSKIVGFCMFYLPYVEKSPETGEDVVMLPTPLRPRPPPPVTSEPTVFAADTNSAQVQLDGSAVPAPGRISIEQTNLGELLSERRAILEKLVGPTGVGYVRYMCVDPAYRRLGIGRRLMEWGCNLFDEAGADAYLVATFEGESLYAHFGFDHVGAQVLLVDGVEAERYPCMFRKSRPRGTTHD